MAEQTYTRAEIAMRDQLRETTDMVLYQRTRLMGDTGNALAISCRWSDGTREYMSHAYSLAHVLHPVFIESNPFLSSKHAFDLASSWVDAIDQIVAQACAEHTTEDIATTATEAAQLAIYRDVVESQDTLFETILAHLRRCESPLERAFLVHYASISDQGFEDLSDPERFQSQYVVGPYRLDFAFFPVFTPAYVAVEVDGHNYHERTVEQAVHDRSRDRALQIMGWDVLRFHRAEIEHSPLECVLAVNEHISAVIERQSEIPM